MQRTTCKQCWGNLNTGQIEQGRKFCSRKCRARWQRRHEVKGAKRRAARGDFVPNVGAVVDCDSNSQ
jgi:hypothetical protein